MHRNSVRLDRLEGEYRQRRNIIMDRIAAYMSANMGPGEYASFCAALERNLRDGEKAEYTEDEIAACVRYDELARARPDILEMIERMCDPGYVG